MLIEFQVGNFKSFKDTAILSMVAATHIKSKNKDLDRNNVFDVNRNIKLLKAASIYGANASGKSSLIQSIYTLKQLVFNSVKDEDLLKSLIVPHALNTESHFMPTLLEITFFHNETTYRYGIKVIDNEIDSEWLYMKQNKPRTKETELFLREGQNITVNPYKFREGKGLEKRTMKTALFLTVVKQFNGTISNEISDYFKQHLIVDLGLSDEFKQTETISFVKLKPENKEAVIEFLKFADLSIDDISFDKMPLADGTQKEVVFTRHKKYDAAGNYVQDTNFRLDLLESEGTKKLFACSGIFIEVLWRGGVLVIDELNARLHPSITKQLIRLFLSKATNPKNAQLIYATHDTNLLNGNFLRRDQIWFAEKNRYGATDLYSLVEFKEGRHLGHNISIEKEYLQGKYGAIPFIGDNTFLNG